MIDHTHNGAEYGGNWSCAKKDLTFLPAHMPSSVAASTQTATETDTDVANDICIA
jgi:hypothetical protein